MQKIKPMI